MKYVSMMTAAAALLALGAGGAGAQQQYQQAEQQGLQMQQQANQQRDVFTPIGEWSYDGLYQNSLRGEDLLGAEVFGAEGDDLNEEIGNVENVIIDQNDRIVAIIAEVGGFWDMADTHVAVPWEQVTFTQDGIHIPVNEERIEEYSLFAEDAPFNVTNLQQPQRVDDDLVTGPRLWRLTELLDDYVVLSNGAGYGYVDDALFDQTGTLQAVVMTRDVGYGAGGRVAYPFSGYGVGWQPGYDYYQLPYDAQEVAGIEPFEYDRMDQGFWD